ncbi:hypothetical protein ACFL02_04600 [Planctomycetota bacterium]
MAGKGVPLASNQSPRRKRHRIRRAIIIFLLLVFILVWSAPYLVSTNAGTKLVISTLNDYFGVRVEAKKLSLSWRGPCQVMGVKVLDSQDRKALDVEKITWSRGLWRALVSAGDFETIDIFSAQTVAYISEKGDQIWPMDWNFPQPKGQVVVHDSTLLLVKDDGRTLEVSHIEGQLDIDTLDNIKAAAQLELGQSKINSEINISQLLVQGQIDPEKATGTLELTIDNDMSLEPLLEFVQEDLGIGGKTQLKVKASYQAGQVVADLSTKLIGLYDKRSGPKKIQPIDLSFEGHIQTEAEQVMGWGNLDGQAGNINTKFSYQWSEAPAEILWEDLPAAVLTGKTIALPEFSFQANGQINLPALAAAIPSVLKIRPGLQITEGQLRIDKFSGQGGSEPRISGTVQLVNLKADQKGQTKAMAPVTVDYDMYMEADIGLRIDHARLQSDFAQMSTHGSSTRLQGEFSANLNRLHEQLSEFLELPSLELAGDIKGKYEIDRSEQERINVSLDLAGKTFRYLATNRQFNFEDFGLNYQGYLALKEQEPERLVITSADVNLDNHEIAGFSGWYDLQNQGLHGELEMKQADGEFIARQVKTFSNIDLSRYAGLLDMQTQIDRNNGEGPLVSKGRILLQRFTVDEEPLTEQDIIINWSGLQYLPDDKSISVEEADIKSELANVNARNIHYHAQQGPSLDGQFELIADLARFISASEKIAKKDYPPKVAGQLTWSGICQTERNMFNLAGEGGIEELQIGSGDAVFREAQVKLIHNTTLDLRNETIHLAQTKITSSTLTAQIDGTIDKYRSVRELDLSGNYEGSLERITNLLHELFPSMAQNINLTGTSKSDFRIAGVARQPDVQPTFRDVESNVIVGWDSAEIYGVKLGPAVFSPRLTEGQIHIPLTTITAQNGKLNLKGFVDLQTAEPTLYITEQTQIIENIPLDAKQGEQFLSYVNPIFAQMAQLSGQASLVLADVEIPLTKDIKTKSTGNGILDLMQMQFQPAGIMAELLKILELNTLEIQPLKVEKAKFYIKDGRVLYDDFHVIVAQTYDLKFYGSVGFDDTLDLAVSLPVKPALLEKLGVKQELARLFADVRLDIPIVGTRTKPILNLSGVDLQPLFKQTVENKVKDARRALENIFKIIKK